MSRINKPRSMGQEKSRAALGGGRFRGRPAWRLFRLYYRGGPEHIPQMSDFFLHQMGDVLTEGVCFDTRLARGNGGWSVGEPPFSANVSVGYPRNYGRRTTHLSTRYHARLGTSNHSWVRPRYFIFINGRGSGLRECVDGLGGNVQRLGTSSL